MVSNITSSPPGAGALGETSFAPSPAELEALLRSLLLPKGKNAMIGALLQHGSYALSFHAPAAGQLVIAWYLVPRGAHVAAAKPVLAALGRASFAQTGLARATVRLTAKGRSLLKHAKRLKLTARGVLTPTGGVAARATESFTLRR
jgi:hypothetical protein